MVCASSMTHRSSHGVPFSEGRNSNACSRVVPQHPIAKQSRPNARVEKGRIVDEIIEALTVHTYIENESMYPEVRDLAPPTSRTTSSNPTKSTTSRTCWSSSWQRWNPTTSGSTRRPPS